MKRFIRLSWVALLSAVLLFGCKPVYNGYAPPGTPQPFMTSGGSSSNSGPSSSDGSSDSGSSETAFTVEDLYGFWLSTYDEEFIIDSDYFISGYAGDFSYAGPIEDIVFANSKSGYIYIRYEYKPDYESVAPWGIIDCNSDGVGDADDGWCGSSVGKYYAIHFEFVAADSIKLAGASKSPDFGNGKATLAEAISEYTVAKGYYAIHSACGKEDL